MYAPDWFLQKHADELDLFKVSADGRPADDARKSEYRLNYHHPAVREYVQDFVGRYAACCRNEPGVLFHENALEAVFNLQLDGYGPTALTGFRAWLKSKYGAIESLNEAWGSYHGSFDDIPTPPDGYARPRDRVTPVVAEFERFREDAYIDFLKLVYGALKASDPDRPLVSRHFTLPGNVNGARLLETCDVLSAHQRAPYMQMLNVYLNSLNRYARKGLGYMEDWWGIQEERSRVTDEVAQRRGLEKHIARTCIWGRTLQMKWYSLTTGAYLTEYNGNWSDPRYDGTIYRYCVPALARAKRKMERFDWVLTHSAIVPSRLLVLQPSATMRNERPRADRFDDLCLLHDLFYPNGQLYELIPEEYFEQGRARLADFDAVVLPSATYLCTDLQEDLGTFVKEGGTLLAAGAPGRMNEIGRPSGALLDALQGASQAPRWEEVERVWGAPADELPGAVQIRCGSGLLVACPDVVRTVTGPSSREVLKLLADRVRRAAWTESGRLEVVLRIAENGDRYLFVLNPDVDATVCETVHLADPVVVATDVSVPEGFPVPVRPLGKGSAIDLTLAPAESTGIHLAG
jgi:hypothetical protein